MVEIIIAECVTSTTGVLLLWLMPVVAVFFVVLALVSRAGFLGLFGGLILLMFSLFSVACVGFFAYVVALFSLVLIVYFAVVKS